MQLLEERTTRVLATVLLFAAALGFVYAARNTLIAFLFAIFFAYLVDPLVEIVSRRFKNSRGKGIFVVYLGIFLCLGVLLAFIGPNIVHEGEKLAGSIPSLYSKISSGQIAWQVGSQRGWSRETIQRLQEFLASHNETITRITSDVGTRLANIGKNAWWIVLIPILAVFFLKDATKFRAATLEVFERRRQREFVQALIRDIHLMLAHFIRAQLILAALTGVVFSIVLTLMRVQYGYVLGVISGFLEFIPIVGPLIAAALILGVAIGTAYGHVIVLVVFLAVWRGLQDYVNSPRIMGSQVELHPLLALFGVLAGAEIGGIIGVYLSIPMMAAARIFWTRWQAYQTHRQTTIVPSDAVTSGDHSRAA